MKSTTMHHNMKLNDTELTSISQEGIYVGYCPEIENSHVKSSDAP